MISTTSLICRFLLLSDFLWRRSKFLQKNRLKTLLMFGADFLALPAKKADQQVLLNDKPGTKFCKQHLYYCLDFTLSYFLKVFTKKSTKFCFKFAGPLPTDRGDIEHLTPYTKYWLYLYLVTIRASMSLTGSSNVGTLFCTLYKFRKYLKNPPAPILGVRG